MRVTSKCSPRTASRLGRSVTRPAVTWSASHAVIAVRGSVVVATMHRAQGIGCGRDLSRIADQDLDVFAHAPGVVTLADEVVDRLARRPVPCARIV